MTLADISFTNLDELFLTGVVTYGPSILCLILFIGALGIPLPGTFLVLAAGAFVRQDVLSLYTTFPLALLGACSGDTGSYGIGRFARGWIQRKLAHATSWQSAEKTFHQRGGVTIYLSRWLLTPIAIPTNLIAGSSGYPLWRFVAYDVAGELTWLILFGGLGYAFGSQWEIISDFVSDFSGVLLGVVVLGIGLYFLLRKQRAEVEDETEIKIETGVEA